MSVTLDSVKIFKARDGDKSLNAYVDGENLIIVGITGDDATSITLSLDETEALRDFITQHLRQYLHE